MCAGNLKNLTISGHNITGLLPHKIKNVKKLTIPSTCLQPLAVLFPTSLTYLEITGDVSGSDLAVLTNIVQSHPTLEVLNINTPELLNLTELVLSTLVEAAGNSHLKLIIGKCDIIELFNYENTNPKEVIILSQLLQPLSSLLPNITSLTCLEITGHVSDKDLAVLTNIVQSHPTLEVLEIERQYFCDQLQLSLLVEVASKSQLKELRLHKRNYNQLPSHIREAHKQLLNPTMYNS